MKRFSTPALGSLLAAVTIAVYLPALAAIEESAPEEITITGKKGAWALQEAVYAAEEKFYSLYNEINVEDDYDIECGWDVPTGSKLRYHKCQAKYEVEANAQWAQDVVANAAIAQENNTLNTTDITAGARSREGAAAYHDPILAFNIERAMFYNPELAEAGKELAELKAQLGKRARVRNAKYPGMK